MTSVQFIYPLFCQWSHDSHSCYTALSLTVCTHGFIRSSLSSMDKGKENLGPVCRCLCTICRHRQKCLVRTKQILPLDIYSIVQISFKLHILIMKTKIMASGPKTSWQIDGETVETVIDFILLGFKITADGNCSHEIKRCLSLGKKL